MFYFKILILIFSYIFCQLPNSYHIDNLDENSRLILNKIADFLILNTEKNLQINGHADERGTEKYNMKLSLRRAEVVYKYLIKK